MTSRIFYAIMQHSTGWFLPEPDNQGGFTGKEFREGNTPRLFLTKRAARNALTWWLKGTTYCTGGNSSWSDDGADWHFTAKPERILEGAIVVTLELTVIGKVSHVSVPRTR